MTKRESRYDILFEPMAIGPVIAKNRFFQVPHCNGGGYRDPSSVAKMRNIKAEGGWAVINTEQAEIHASSEITPFIELRIWDDKDLPMLHRITDAVHEHDALAGIELCYNGMNGPNLHSREVPMGPMAVPIATFTNDPIQARAMDKRDIKNLRNWHRNAAIRAKRAGFDLVYVYGAHGFGAVQHFLSRHTNQRTDEYGGSLENRARLLRELIEDTKDAIGDSCAVPVRVLIDEMMGDKGITNNEMRDVVSMLAELPDLWDFTHGNWADDSATARFKDEGSQEEYVKGFKQLTTKPVVGVGRFTSPDTMVRQIKSGILDFIGCARPSIADPFLPKKIDEGRTEDIRECIGCNICVTGDMTGGLSRCTQNPTFMEEWRKDWHPEKMQAKGKSENVLIIGSGPAGLEAARALGLRGYDVLLAEAGTELGGRVTRESKLPGLSSWGRVRDYRQGQIEKMANVSVYFESKLTADQVVEFGFENIAIATGAQWRKDGTARHHLSPIPIAGDARIYTPDDVMNGKSPQGDVLIYDDDHYYMGGTLAELLINNGCNVTIVTPATRVSDWTVNTLEQHFIQKKLIHLGVKIVTTHSVSSIDHDHATLECTYSGNIQKIATDAVLLVTCMESNDQLWDELKYTDDKWSASGIKSIKVIGDAEAPAPIAWATYAGHRYARELDEIIDLDISPFKREVVGLSRNWS
ncbi:MAG: NAD(P)-binding protein [Gammaproteobacteria bacterium]|nr:NAD(P)-binding protein [Gammaproteobacteria bacterium]